VPGVKGTAGGSDGENGKHSHDRMTNASAAAAVALGAAEHLVGGQAQQPGHHLGQRQSLAVAAFP